MSDHRWAIAWLNECANYFDKKLVGSKEDREHWALVYNRDNAKLIALLFARILDRDAITETIFPVDAGEERGARIRYGKMPAPDAVWHEREITRANGETITVQMTDEQAIEVPLTDEQAIEVLDRDARRILRPGTVYEIRKLPAQNYGRCKEMGWITEDIMQGLEPVEHEPPETQGWRGYALVARRIAE